MKRHDQFSHRLSVLRALLRQHWMWMDTVCISQRSGLPVKRVRTELRALRREGRLSRCDRGRWNLGSSTDWARHVVDLADEYEQGHRTRLAMKAEEVRKAFTTACMPSCSDVMTWDEMIQNYSVGSGIFKK